MALSAPAYGAAGKAAMAFNVTGTGWDDDNVDEALAAGDGFDFLFQGHPKTVGVDEPDESMQGSSVQGAETRVAVDVSSTPINMYAGYYNNCARFWAGLFGSETTAQLGATPAYSHLFTLDELNLGNWWTWAFHNNLHSYVYPYNMSEKITLIIEQGKKGIMQVTPISKICITDNSATNKIATITSNVTLPTIPSTRFLLLGHTVVRVNAQTGGALGSGDVVKPSRVEITFERTYERSRSTATGLYIQEPAAGGWKMFAIKMLFTRWDTTTELPIFDNATPQKADVTITGALISGAFYYTWLFEYPHLWPTTEGTPDTNNPNLLSIEWNFKGKRATANPTGMAFTLPRLTITDISTADHLSNG